MKILIFLIAMFFGFNCEKPSPLDVEIYTLENGLTVMLNEDRNETSVFGAVVIDGGGKRDPSDATGIAHYLEHVLFKGTSKMGTTNYAKEKVYLDSIEVLYDELSKKEDKKTRLKIQRHINDLSVKASEYAIPNEFTRLIEGMGGTGLNAGTGYDFIYYFNSFPSAQIEKWVDLYSHRFLDPVFRLFQSELETVYEEKNRAMDNPFRVFNETSRKYFFKNHPYGQQTILGSVEHLKTPSLSKMKEYYNKYYVPNNMHLLIAGDFDKRDVKKLIKAKFGKLKKGADVEQLDIAEDDFSGREVVDLAYKLEGIARNVGKHAGGVVIAPGSLSDFCPIYNDRQSSSVMTQYDKDDVEKIGLVKFDFLGLRTLTVIDKALKSININLKNKLDLDNIPMDDQKVFDLLSSGKTMAVFQLESTGMRDLIKKLKPTKFEEITALLALYRPGPLNSGMHTTFVDRKHGKSPVTYPHELLEPVLSETYGVIVYQEQVMESARVLAGYSMGEADILRRVMGKKKIEEMEEQREIFVKGCKKNSIPEKKANKIFELIEQFAEYGFNKSHSAAYAVISYQTAFLKTYYPEHFMAAVLSTELGNTDKIHALIQECKRMGIKVLKPNILTSNKMFLVNNNSDIEYGLGAIKGVADAFIQHVCQVRKSNKFNDLWDFSKKVDIKLGGKKSLEALSQSGSFDSIAPSRSVAVSCIEDMLKDGSNNSSKQTAMSGDLFSSLNESFDPYEKYKNITDIGLSELLSLEKKSLGYYLSGHPVNAIEKKINKLRSKTISKLDHDTKKASIVCLVNSVRQIKDKKGKPLTFINFDDGTGVMDGVVPSEVLDNCHAILKEGQILIVKGVVEIDDYRSKELGDAMFRMRVKEVHSLDSELSKKVKDVVINLDESELISLDEFSDKLEKVKREFWQTSGCNLFVKVITNDSEAIIDIGEKFRFEPTIENLNFLDDIFGKNALEI